MICEEDIYDWFRDSASSRRIDVLCSLLRLCLPLELRFVGSCLEDLARKDYRSLQEYELRANDESGYATLANATTTTTPEELQNMLNIYVSLLHSTNTVCANSLFRILEGLYDKIQLTLAQGLSGSARSIGNENPAAEDLLLLFTMAAHHPAFAFSQRIKICEVLMNVKQVLNKLGLIKFFQRQPDTATRNSVGNSSHLMASRSPKSCDNNSQSCPMPSTTLRYYVTVLEMRRNIRNRSTEFCLETNWPDGERVQLWKPYKDLQIFHEELERHFSGISGDKSLSWHLPQFPVKEKNSQNDTRMSDAMKIYIREIFSLPFNITGDDRFRHIFQDLFKKCDAAIVSASVSVTLSPSLPVGKTQASLSAPTSPHSAFPTSLPPSAKTVVSKLPNDSILNRTVTIAASQVTSASLQSSQSNHLMESSTRCVPSSRSSPLSSRSSAFLLSQDARSRHKSSQGYASIGAWLKDIRLHKYAAQLAKYSWDELFRLTDSDLQKEGFTSGACKKFANEIDCLKTRWGSNLEALSVSSNSSRTCTLMNPSSSKQCAVPMATMITKSVPGMSYPGSIDSSCSDYFTPPGSPEPQQSSISKSRIRTGFGQQTFMTSFAIKERDELDASKSTVISQPSDMLAESDVPALQSSSFEALAQQYTTGPVGIRPIYVPTVDSVNCDTYPDESSVSGIIQAMPESYERATTVPIHESVSVLRTPDPVADMTRGVIDQMKGPFHPHMSALSPWQISTQEQQVWSASRTANVQPLVPYVGSTEVQAFCSESHSEGVNLAVAHPEDIVVEITSHSSGFNPQLPVLDSPIMSPPFPIPSDAVLVRPRLSIGMPPIARIPAIVSPATHFSNVTSSNVGVVTGVVTKNCSPLATDRSSNPQFPLHGPPSAVLYPPVAPISPAFHPQPVLNQIIAGTQNKTGYHMNHAADMPDLSNLSPAVLNPSAFPGDNFSSAESQPVEMVNQPSGLANFMPGFFGLQPPLPSPAVNLPVMHSGTPAVMSPACHSVSQNVVSFTGNNDPTIGDTICHRCQQYEQFLCMIPYQNVWPAETMFPRSACFSVIAPQHVSPQFRPLHGTQLQNGMNPDLHYRYSWTGTRPLHAVRPGCAAPFPRYVFYCRSGPTASLSGCSNCGSSDHSHLECKERTVESVLGAGCYHLNIIPKTETG